MFMTLNKVFISGPKENFQSQIICNYLQKSSHYQMGFLPASSTGFSACKDAINVLEIQ